jgi:hypothetical protein
MSYPKSSQRNQAILDKYLAGETLTTIAKDFGITRQRIHQIVNATSIEDDKKIDKIVHRALNRKSKRASN